ncbi:cardiolipin synthase [Guggenheimella bovis]
MKKRTLVAVLIGMLSISLLLVVVQGKDSLQYWAVFKEVAHYSFVVYAIGLCFLIFIDNNSPQATIAWLVVFYVDAYIGFLAYILVGRNLFKRREALKKQEHAKNTEAVINIPYANSFDTSNDKLKTFLSNKASSQLSTNNDVEIFTSGAEKFDRLFQDLEEAKETIHLEYFIFKNGFIFDRLKDILIRKARAGVKVRLIYDSVGTVRLKKSSLQELKDAGIDLAEFYPVVFPILSRKLNYRNHRKIVVIDGKIGYVGGMNVGDEYVGLLKRFGFWRDTHLRIVGDGVWSLQRIFLNDWNFIRKEILNDASFFPQNEEKNHIPLQIAESGPDYNLEVIKQAYFTLVTSATDRLWITSPYLVPDEGIKDAIMNAALSGVDVRIIIPSKQDHFFVYWASQDNIEDFLQHGVRIFSYEGGFIHAKVVISDDRASVGTANMDIRSLAINYEVNAFLYNKEVTDKLSRDFLEDTKHSREIILEEHEKRSVFRRVLESLGRLLSPLQ